jgi:hypothetical protein
MSECSSCAYRTENEKCLKKTLQGIQLGRRLAGKLRETSEEVIQNTVRGNELNEK